MLEAAGVWLVEDILSPLLESFTWGQAILYDVCMLLSIKFSSVLRVTAINCLAQIEYVKLKV